MSDGTKIVAALEDAQRRIDKPSKWMQYQDLSDDGRRACAGWAVTEATIDDGALRVQVEAELARCTSSDGRVDGALERLQVYNDSHSHRSVMKLFDRAIAAVREWPR